MALMEWAVDRVTVEKLEGRLNEISEKGREVDQVTWIGARDWVIISFRRIET